MIGMIVSHFVYLWQALDCVDGTTGWGDENMHAFRSPGTETDCSNNQPVYVLRNEPAVVEL
jgi:hypothetical protein